MATRKIVVLGTGGTLAGTSAKPGDNVGYTAAQLGVGQLLAGLPLPQGIAFEVEQVAQVDSKDMSMAIWRSLEARCAHWLAQEDVEGIVVTHGTDTIEETAFYLQQALWPEKPVVMTCAMRPATATSPDGPQNIVDAIRVASSQDAGGVFVVCAGVIHEPAAIVKVHHYRLDPFSSGDEGPVGYVVEGQVRIVRPWPQIPDLAYRTKPVPLERVEIVTSHAGASRHIVDALVKGGVQGIVVACTGNGTVHQDLLPALLEAQAKGVKVLRASRCAFGGVIPADDDVLPSTNLSPVKARILLLLGLA